MTQKPLYRSLDANLALLEEMFGRSDDFYTKRLMLAGIPCAIVMFTGLSSPEKLCHMALDMLDRDPAMLGGGEGLCDYLLTQSRVPAEPDAVEDRTALVELLSNGLSVLLIDGVRRGVAFSTQEMPQRSISTPMSEGTLRGPLEAFTELPPMLEMLCVTLLLEIVREAGLRAPQSISHPVSLVGALIIGETAVSAGIVSVPVLTMAAAATIATLAVPSLYEQSILFRFAVIVLAGCFGVPGLACAALTILAMACGSEPFGYDYLYPLMPPGRASVRDGFVRSIWSRLAKSGEVISRHEA